MCQPRLFYDDRPDYFQPHQRYISYISTPKLPNNSPYLAVIPPLLHARNNYVPCLVIITPLQMQTQLLLTVSSHSQSLLASN